MIDSGNESSIVTLWIRVKTVAILLSDSDSDNDGVADINEGTGDSDGDGVAEYQDSASQPANILPLPDGKMIQVANGHILQLGQNAFGGENGTATTSLNDIASYGGSAGGISTLNEGFSAQSEIFDFCISGLSGAGEKASLVIALGNTIPANAVYRKFLPQTGWVSLSVGNGYNIESTQSENGICPNVSSTVFTEGLTEGDNCVRLTLVDGGEYDGDGIANGFIEDPGMIAVAVSVATEAPSISIIPTLSMTESEVLHLNNNDAELRQYVTDIDSNMADIQFSIINAGSIDPRFGISIGMSGTSFIDRADNSIHAHPDAGFSGTTQVQVQAKDSDDNLSNVVTLSLRIDVLPNSDTSDSGGGGVINIWMLLMLLSVGLIYVGFPRVKVIYKV